MPKTYCLLLLAVLFILPAAAHAAPPAADEPGMEARPPAATGWPDKIGPFSISDSSGRFSLAVGLAAQLQVRVRSTGTDELDTETTVFMRRIRPTFKGTALSKDLKWYLHLSTAPGSVEFMDFYLDYTFMPYLRLRAGNCKVPFTRYRIQSFKHLTFVDWSVVTRYFGNERQYGVTLHSGYEKPMPIEYAVGVYTGQNARASHTVGLQGLYGEPRTNPSNLLDPAGPSSFHPEIVGRVAYNFGGIKLGTDTDFAGGGTRFSAGLSFAWDTRPAEFIDLAFRLAPEVLFKAYGFSFSAIGYVGLVPLEDSESGADTLRLALAGALVQASYLIRGRVELSLRYGLVTVDDTVRAEAKDRADRLISIEPDPVRLAVLIDQYGGAGLTRAEQEATLGVNVYIIGRSLKWQTDLGFKSTQREGKDTKHDVQFRTQVGLAF